MARQGRDLEKLVATLETIFSGKEIEVKSPDYIRGVNSGSLREIDVALRAKVGSAQILVILEARDRQGTEDVDWIEQLATKRDDVLASKVIAISSSGFSEGAKNTATRLGIELRTVDSLTADDVTDWLRTPYLETVTRHGDLVHVEIRAESQYRDVLKAAIAGIDTNTPLLVHTETGNSISINQAWQEILNQNPQLFAGLNPDDEPRRVNLSARYINPNSRYQILAGKELVHITEIVFQADLYIEVIRDPISQVTQYSTVNGERLARSVRFKSSEVGNFRVDVCSAPQKLDSGLKQHILFSTGAQHESPSSIQSRIQGSRGTRSDQRCEERRRDLSRASTQARPVLEMESAVSARRRPCLSVAGASRSGASPHR